jgi:GTP-binding protein
VPEAQPRTLVNGMRDAFDLPGTPIRITLREKDNSFAERKKRQR